MRKIRKAVFPVGGLGTRFLPATKAMPKEMLTVVNKPVIQYAYEEAVAAGIEQFIFITGRNKNVISNHFDNVYETEKILEESSKTEELRQTRDWLPEPGNVIFIRQQNALGLGHAVWCARHIIGDEPFAVILPDDIFLSRTPCMKQLVDAYARIPGSNLVAVMDLPREETRKYGVLDVLSQQGDLTAARGVVEKPSPEDAPSTLCVSGRYILQPEIFALLEHQAPGKGQEIQLTDALNRAIPNVPMHGLHIEGERFDCGSRAGFVEANLAFALTDPELRERILGFLGKYS